MTDWDNITEKEFGIIKESWQRGKLSENPFGITWKDVKFYHTSRMLIEVLPDYDILPHMYWGIDVFANEENPKDPIINEKMYNYINVEIPGFYMLEGLRLKTWDFEEPFKKVKFKWRRATREELDYWLETKED